MRTIKGDLITLALQGEFDVITHGCNIFCTMGAGIAPQMARAFEADKFVMENQQFRGDVNKLGTIDYETQYVKNGASHSIPPNDYKFQLTVVNAYTQINYGRNHSDGDMIPFDYAAFEVILKKMAHTFKGQRIGLPRIGSGLGGGDEQRIELLIRKFLAPHCDVTIVEWDKN